MWFSRFKGESRLSPSQMWCRTSMASCLRSSNWYLEPSLRMGAITGKLCFFSAAKNLSSEIIVSYPNSFEVKHNAPPLIQRFKHIPPVLGRIGKLDNRATFNNSLTRRRDVRK